MVWCRTALGDPPHLASLGRQFFAIMAAQVLLLAVCFDPQETLAWARALVGRSTHLTRR